MCHVFLGSSGLEFSLVEKPLRTVGFSPLLSPHIRCCSLGLGVPDTPVAQAQLLRRRALGGEKLSLGHSLSSLPAKTRFENIYYLAPSRSRYCVLQPKGPRLLKIRINSEEGDELDRLL